MAYTLTQLNNQYVEVDGLIDGTTKYLGDGVTLNPSPAFLNNASGTAQVKDPNGTPVVIGPGAATSVAATYVATSNGNYRFLITSVFNPTTLGQGYTIVLDLTAPGGFVGHWELPVEVKARKL
jgi:hypothetical protein